MILLYKNIHVLDKIKLMSKNSVEIIRALRERHKQHKIEKLQEKLNKMEHDE